MKTRWLYAGLGYLTTVIGSYIFVQLIHMHIAPIPHNANMIVLFLVLSPFPNISHFFSIGIGYYMGLRKEFNRKLRKRSLGAILGYLLAVFIWLLAGLNIEDVGLMFSVFIVGLIPVNLPHSLLLLVGHFMGKNFETTEELEQYQIAAKNMKHRKKTSSSKPRKTTQDNPLSFKEVSAASVDTTDTSKHVSSKRLSMLKGRNTGLFLADIETLLKKSDFESKEKAAKLLSEREHSLDRYGVLYNELGDIRSKIMKLTDRIADGELDSETYKRALNDLEMQQRESEEDLWTLRSDLFKEEYEKPF